MFKGDKPGKTGTNRHDTNNTTKETTMSIADGVLNASDWDGIEAGRPLLSKGARTVTIGKITEEVDATKDGTKRMKFNVPLVLTEATTDLDGKPVNAGFVVTDDITTLVGREKFNAISLRRKKQFILAALGLPLDTTGAVMESTLAQMGGFAALTGRNVIAFIGTRADQKDENALYQDVKSYSAAK